MKKILLASLFVALSGCSGVDYVDVPSSNKNSRVRYLVIHHTALNFERSLKALTEPNGVSSHYLIPEHHDESYVDDELKVYRLVNEGQRAWHAGLSQWEGVKNLNDQSIGIELVQVAPCVKSSVEGVAAKGFNVNAASDRICFYPDFDNEQIGLLIDLAKDILSRYPEIEPTRVVGHADITPGRRVDPGPRFPWQRLYQAGIGAWYDDDTVARYWDEFKVRAPSVETVQAALSSYGYGLEQTGILDAQTINTLTVFQMHFRPWEVTGEPSLKTVATLFALIEKYRPESLPALIAATEGIYGKSSGSGAQLEIKNNPKGK